MHTIKITGLQALPGAAAKMLDILGDKRVIAFFGEMGAGKTTVIKALCQKLEVLDVTSSPSFGLINEYRSDQGDKVYHFDFFRIRDMEEAFDLGVEEYFHSGNYCFIEWPEKIEDLLPPGTLIAEISVGEHDERIIEMKSGL